MLNVPGATHIDATLEFLGSNQVDDYDATTYNDGCRVTQVMYWAYLEFEAAVSR